MLDQFVNGYIECMLCVGVYPLPETGNREFTRADIAPESMSEIIDDCTNFYGANSDLWRDDSSAGHDFLLTRNRHGTGFWDRDDSHYVNDSDVPQDDIGGYLTRRSHEFGTQGLYVGDDGRLYVHS